MPQFDLVIFGASSFVGQILCRHLQHLQEEQGLVFSWAIAGRSAAKLSALKAELGLQELEVIVANADDEMQLQAMCQRSKVVVSTVGPYALFGELLVKTCVSQGTDYCDLTGEVQWIAKMLARYEHVAKITGARIVNCCGFDSVPSDLGVYFLQQHAKQQQGEYCPSVKMRVQTMRGEASGGTVASMTNIFKEVAFDRQLRRTLADPYAICPAEFQSRISQKTMNLPQYDDDFSSWVAPFVMAVINTRIVLRSNALLAEPYSQEFSYNEAMLTGQGVIGSTLAMGIGAGLGGFAMAAVIPPTRWLMTRTFLPKPGEGPSEQAQREGSYDLRFLGISPSGQHIKARVTGDQDPGYGSTAKILAQAALCLCQDINKETKGGGFWTPAAIFGETLIQRLEQHAGLRFELIP
ncbi:MAG: saccharopine dehydrogenase [Paraglaciecola sp.]|nr:saccharopine dehydrogenase [Paraglaciecola sp.]NCT49062.1 saccharopine dehydrogenase [Paraglaciecola sp.]